MFKSIFALATLLPAIQVQGVVTQALDDAAEVQCQVLTTTDATIFSILGLENKTGPYKHTMSAGVYDFRWNYCTFSSDATGDHVYAHTQSLTGNNDQAIVADKAIPALSATNIRDADSKTIGVSFTQGSDNACTKTDGTSTTWAMTTELLCDKDITVAPTITSVTSAECVYTVKMKHADGCPEINIDLEYYSQWLSDNQWAIGVIYVIAGPIIALLGMAWFPYVCASIVGIFVIGLICSLSLAFGWMTSTTAGVIIFVVALIVGVLAGILVRRKIWLMVGLLGLIAGFFSGSLVFALVGGMTGWKAAWGYWVISVAMAAIGCLLACYAGKAVVLVGTSLVGSYMFMRAWTLFFPGHYPSEQELMDDHSTLEFDSVFWVFIAVFIVSFIGSVIFQKKRDVTHDDLENDDDFKGQ